MLVHRLLTGGGFIGLLLLLLWADAAMGAVTIGCWTLPAGLLLAIAGSGLIAVGANELTAVASAAGLRIDRRLTAGCVVVVMLTVWVSATLPEDFDVALPLTVIALSLVASLLRFSRGQCVEGVFASTAVVMLAVIYLGVLAGFLLLIGAEISIWMIGGVALVVKCSDIGAFFTGSLIGRHKLIPWLSPGKTVEGLLGGVVTSMAAAAILNWALDAPLPLWWVLIMGAVLALVGQAGDLTMSLFKRGAGLKDASTLLPGLGGVMDVIDSLLLTAPVAWWMLRLSLT